MNKKMIIGIILFVTGVLGTGLFSIAQSNMVIAEATLKAANLMNTKSGTLNGLFMILCIAFAICGAVLLVLDFIKKEEK